ncbi:MAG TPA: DNA-3-methyladenine glycosylase [bacterium]|nr:DNA-3-methyladenine glycosylase [bacterium]HPJ71401.1 DNA-3-methyladenine glycosylase [bacterium]HPQ66220.1 DNA-3-methyladenine glycosylase [bacterium]
MKARAGRLGRGDGADGPPPTPLPRKFYERGTVRVAEELLGKILVRRLPEGVTAGRIVETEAYLGPGDPASHARNGPTPRSRIMFGQPGRAYVYFCYGFHFLLNVVTEKEGTAGAVLLRALEPSWGEAVMEGRRGGRNPLASGPGRLTQAMSVDLTCNGLDLALHGTLYVAAGEIRPEENVVRGPRVGIREGLEHPWRFRLIPRSRE